MTFRFHKRYFIITLVLLLTEVLIAVYVHDEIIRPYIGDFLVVILMYCFLRTFTTLSTYTAAIRVLLFAFLIEASQYFHLLSLLGWEHSIVAKITLGNSFAWMDLVMYAAGIVFVIVVETVGENRRNMV